LPMSGKHIQGKAIGASLASDDANCTYPDMPALGLHLSRLFELSLLPLHRGEASQKDSMLC
jgi:hypothetical protein